MDIQKAEFKHEIDVETLSNYENKIKEITTSNTEENPSELNVEQTLNEYFVPELIKIEEINIKREEEEWNQFSTNEFSEKQIQDVYFDSKSIKQEVTEIKTENEEGNEFSTKSSPVESDKGLHLNNKAASLYGCINANLEGSSVFKCFKCSYQTYKKQNLSSHVRSHMSKSFECPLCPYKSNNKNSLHRHQLVHIPEPSYISAPNALLCPEEKMSYPSILLTHKKPDEIIWHMKIHEKDQSTYKCTLCSYNSFRKDRLQLHLNRVHEAKDLLSLLSCLEESCSFKTGNKSSLQRHIRELHKNQKIFKCPKCLYETKYVRNLKAHKLGHRDSDNWFSCSLCPYKTPYRASLNNHALVHKSANEVKYFQCSECAFKTKHKYALKQHEVKHSSEVKEITECFYCYVCTWRTHYKMSLARHLRTVHRDAEGRFLGKL